jgi:MFS family permease
MMMTIVDFSIVFPAMYQLVIKYNGTLVYYGIVFGIYSATQFIAAIWMGSVFALRSM